MKSTKTHSGIFMGITGLLNVTQLISSQPLHALMKIHCGLKSVLQVCTAVSCVCVGRCWNKLGLCELGRGRSWSYRLL